MPADPEPGLAYRQEYYKGEAEDNGEILSLHEQAQVPAGHYRDALLTKDTIAIEPDVLEYKLYAPGVGPCSRSASRAAAAASSSSGSTSSTTRRRGRPERHRSAGTIPRARRLDIRQTGENARVDMCSHCGGTLPADATFCPSCGRRTDAPPVDVRDVPIDVQHAEPRYFGLGTPVFVLSAAALLLLLGIVLAVTGYLVAGVIAIVIAFCLLPAFLAGARRWPDTSIAQLGVSTADRVRDEAGFAVDSVSAWSRAGRDVARLRKEQFTLKRRRDAKVRELGVSVLLGRRPRRRAEGGGEGARRADGRERGRAAASRRERAPADAEAAGDRGADRGDQARAGDGSRYRAESSAEPRAEDEPLTRDEPQAEVEPEPQPKPAAKKRQARSR